jgi:hypothetical protein
LNGSFGLVDEVTRVDIEELQDLVLVVYGDAVRAVEAFVFGSEGSSSPAFRFRYRYLYFVPRSTV